jgi:hypothetical protein
MRLGFTAVSFVLTTLACAKTQKPPVGVDATQQVATTTTNAQPDGATQEPAEDTASAQAADAAMADDAVADDAGADDAMTDGTDMADTDTSKPTADQDKVLLDQFADLRVLRFEVPGWEALPPERRVLIYHLAEASLVANDIHWDQRHPQGLRVKRTLEAIDKSYGGDKSGED